MPTVVGKRARVAIGGLGLVMLLGMTGCSSSSDSGKKADVTMAKVDGLHTYAPKKLDITLNRDESFTFLNKDSIVHNVTVPAFAIDIDVQPGQRVDVKVPAVKEVPRDGFFLFYCKYHQSEGMAGHLNISK